MSKVGGVSGKQGDDGDGAKGEPWLLSKRAPSSSRLLPSGFVGSGIIRSSGIYFTTQVFMRNLPKYESV